MSLFRRKIKYEEIKKFNDEIDNNVSLQEELLNLSKNYQKVSEKEYRKRLLKTFKQAGINISASELDNLIISRLKLEQMAKEKANNENV